MGELKEHVMLHVRVSAILHATINVQNHVLQLVGLDVVMHVHLRVAMHVQDVLQCVTLLAKQNVRIVLDMHV